MNIIYIVIFHVALSFLQSADILTVLSLSGIPEPVNKRVKALFTLPGLCRKEIEAILSLTQ